MDQSRVVKTRMITVVLTLNENEYRVDGFMFNDDGILMAEIELPVVDVPRNVAHWNSLGWTVRDICDLAGPEVDEPEADLLPGEEMDGDHDSAMASAGFGTDEDYGYFGGDGE